MPPQTAGARSKRGLILAAAIESFGQNGYEHTRWAKIADEVGIGHTALYHCFQSKAHCLLTIMSLELGDHSKPSAESPPRSSEPTGRWRRRSPRPTT